MLKKKIIAALVSCAAALSMCAPSAYAVSLKPEVSVSKASDQILYTDASGFIYKIYEYGDERSAYITGYKNTSATSLTIPSTLGGLTVKYIGHYAFEDFTSLKTIVMPATVEEIGIAAFRNCYKLSNITFAKNLNQIDINAFENCVSLKTVKLPDTVQSIFTEAFWGCSSMTEFHIPASLSYINGSMFNGCTSLKKITFASSTALDTGIASDPSENTPFNISVLYIPPSVNEITVEGGTLSFSKDTYSEFIISGFAGTTAQSFAASQGITFREITPNPLGDVDGEGHINALDASMILTAYAYTATNKTPELDPMQYYACDVDENGNVNAIDASLVLGYYAYTATGGKNSFIDYLNNN